MPVNNVHDAWIALVGARLAGEGVFKDAFAGKPGSYRCKLRFLPFEHETFVMKLNSLRLNVAYFAGCRTFADFAKMGCRTLPFT
ncbi:hypothetical protein [Pseudomonas sp. GM102]|uniref:hypothetical protein n=1 Tax=Pseudomonas sp. GM102 TaxID=1144321 RepID=UPI0012FA2BC1|nr:hypothetical protein [Pseudomonas sp. GM102]